MSESAGKKLLMHAGAGAAGALGVYAASRLMTEAHKKIVAQGRDKKITAMEREHPELRGVSAQDKQRAFAAMVHYAPETVGDPYVGGDIMLNITARGRSPITLLREAKQMETLEGPSLHGLLAKSVGDTAQYGAKELFMNKKAELMYAYDLTSEQADAVFQRVADKLGAEKIAFDWDTAKAVGVPILGAVGAAAVSYGVPAAVEAVRAARIRSNRDKYLAEMKKVHPDMRSISEQDLHIAYNSIAQHTPDVLQDPLLGGQTLKQMAQFRMANVSALNEISRLRGQRPLDVALQNSSNFLGQGMNDAVRGYGAHMDSISRMQLEREKMESARAIQRMRIDADKDRATNQNALLKDRDAAEQARYEADRAYQRYRDGIVDAQEMGRQATAFAAVAERPQPVDPTLYQAARGIPHGNQPMLRADLAQAKLRAALKDPAPAPYKR